MLKKIYLVKIFWTSCSLGKIVSLEDGREQRLNAQIDKLDMIIDQFKKVDVKVDRGENIVIPCTTS